VQIHDYNPGYWPEWPHGIFWTIAVPNPTVEIQPGAGKARWRMEDLEIPDYFHAGNAFVDGPTLPGKVTFEVNWMKKPDSERYEYSHPAEPTEPDSYWVRYWDTAATLEWECETPELGFSFESYDIGAYPGGRTHGQNFAVVGHERSGVFF